jgi:GT2 family glycosyltransferase
MGMVVPIIILVWEGWEDTQYLIESLVKSNINSPIWLVDNGSINVDPLKNIIKIYPEVEYYRLDVNYGFSGGVNRALKIASNKRYKYAYVLNNDCLVDADFLTPMISIADKIKNCGIIGSRYISRGIDGEYSDWGYYSAPTYYGLYNEGFLETDRVVGCGMLININIFFEVGGFDERFFCYAEENDLCYNLQKKGYIVGMCFNSIIKHNHHGSDIESNSIYYRVRNSYLLKLLHPDKNTYVYKGIDVVKAAFENINNYKIFSSYIEGLYCARAGDYGRRCIKNTKIINYLLFIYYGVIFYPSRISMFRKKVCNKITNLIKNKNQINEKCNTKF